MSAEWTLEQLNGLPAAAFVEALGGIFEHSPWVAGAVEPLRPFESAEELHAAMVNAARSAPEGKVLALLRCHPDLGAKLAMSDLSVSEQKGAGLDSLSAEEYERFNSLNRDYMGRFDFPFILAVRGKSKDDILSSLAERAGRERGEELDQALREIARITGFRLADLISE
ncbi:MULTISPECIES: 2-oxo-4-hydroxy-4-carboxy-5-ureidoimidazoline decarboxylase [unclassified Paenibacillus]|uniref:2-oxo-4-hydroxy-4-carboxy-5-ureidoimidazoline decarboxylase n=1 Tax=unclassified Paenibacillus TaxID=185978 RepID=UPI0009549B25|nr:MULTISPECIES: 2-oxo-4-hydroxy-4-carboxy-5-ureidoimidazoline decarboxylase [unclassified Paenibacillus]SIP94144.1 2-oxo-4-hydroxy-4-carboxy-5-ureidoimidazoline decarboxylase [Paenibacillus sp. RU4X]SIQ12598.1 2-oxo-4-hydroxy-4-carboxy-5-ureidoimidazoline decarboxylase [Paenibacillus sp. RU4T]